MANEAELNDTSVIETPPLSLRDTLEAAVEEHSESTLSTQLKPAEKVPTEQAPQQAVKSVTPSGPIPSQEPSKTVAASSTPASGSPAPTGELKAPAQWKPNVREKWNGLPREVQEEILRREGDSLRLIGSVGPKIRLADEMSQHLAPFMDRLKQNNVPPSAFIADVFQSVHTLTRGSPQDQAETIANIIQAYKIDVRLLDQVLSGRIQQPPEVMEARRLAAQARDVIRGTQNFQAQQNAQESERLLTEFAADPKHEFLDDVRDLMADLIESGRAKTLDDAYSAAIWAHADTRQILLQREADARAKQKTSRAVIARRASSSIHGSPAFNGKDANGARPLTLRESLESAFDEHTSL